MAVQKSRKSRARRDTRRANDTLDTAALAVDVTSGETHRRHHVTANGYYCGRQLVTE